MDLLLSSGNCNDRANCTMCAWTAGGTYAEHAGRHHWLDTGHHWTLTPFTPETAR